MSWRPSPTLACEPNRAQDAERAMARKDGDTLRRMGVRWFDWRTRTWRDDHEVWFTSQSWRSAPQYGGRCFIRTAKSARRRARLSERKRGIHMAKLKVVPKVAPEEATTKTKKAKAAKGAGPKKFSGVTTGLTVTEFQNQLMAKNFKAKLTDAQLAAAMRKEFPNAVAYSEEHVRGIRSAWNKGHHSNEKPAKPLPEFDAAGDAQPLWGAKSAAKKAAKAEVADEEEEVQAAPAKKVRKVKVS